MYRFRRMLSTMAQGTIADALKEAMIDQGLTTKEEELAFARRYIVEKGLAAQVEAVT